MRRRGRSRLFRTAKEAGTVAAVHAAGGLVGGLARFVMLGLRVVARFAFGAPLDGVHRTDATFISDGVEDLRSPGFWGRRDASWWAYLAGWKRMGLRWGALLALVVASSYPTQATVAAVVVAGVVLGLAVWRVVDWVLTYPYRRHVEAVVQPVYEVVSQHIGTPRDDDADEWLTISRNFDDDPDALVTLALPRGLDVNQNVQKKVNDVMSRHVHRQLVASWGNDVVSWQKKGALPRMVPYAGHDDPVNILRPAKRANGEWVYVDLQSETPHGFVTAETRQGKSAALRVAAAHVRSKGALVDYIDPKSISVKELHGIPGIRVHTDMESQLWALEEFYASMLGVEKAVLNGANIEDFPVRVLVIDEFGSFKTMAAKYHKRLKSRDQSVGELSLEDQFAQIAWRGGQTRHWMILGAHQPDRRLFGSTDVRSQFGWRMMLGSFNRSSWVTTYGYAPRIRWNTGIKGRGIIGVGESEDRMYEIQAAYMEPEEAVELAMSGPTPADWYANAHLPPWVTAAVLKEADNVAGVSRLSLPGTDGGYAGTTDDPVPGDVPPEPTRETRDRIIVVDGSGEASETPANAPEKASDGENAADSEPVDNVVPLNADVIVGIAAAAEFLGMKRDAFVRARKPSRTPIPGEKRTANGQPYWTKMALRSWASKRKGAGRQWVNDQ